VFILGPSHAFHLGGCALSKCETYETPLGNLKLDREGRSLTAATQIYNLITPRGQVIEELYETKRFEYLSQRRDQGEHSIEMHLPYVYKVFEG
jgi:AmmeMemoRadiSam system protein B